MNRILVICAHPDDETLGLGGTICHHVEKGDKVNVLIFTDGESARGKSNSKIKIRQKQSRKAAKDLGVEKIKFLNYPDQQLDIIAIKDLAKKIESEIKILNPNIIYTHYWGDVNQDHKKLFDATLVACRPIPNSSIEQILCYETPSSTEWGNSFKNKHPNSFVNIEKFLDKKIIAIENYSDEIKPFPHPRSKEAIMNRAMFWGSTVGIHYAEAFYLIRKITR